MTHCHVHHAGIAGGAGPNHSLADSGTTVGEIYNVSKPVGQRWSTVADSQIQRLYHSVAFLTSNADVSLIMSCTLHRLYLTANACLSSMILRMLHGPKACISNACSVQHLCFLRLRNTCTEYRYKLMCRMHWYCTAQSVSKSSHSTYTPPR